MTESQPLDDDLTSLAAASAENALYYRSGRGAWAPVTIGGGIVFDVGTLSAPGGGATEYGFEAPITPPPNARRMRFNNVSAANTTALYVYNTTAGRNDIRRVMLDIPIGALLYVQDKNNSANFVKFMVDARPIDRNTYIEVPVIAVGSGGVMSNDARVLLYMAGSAGGVFVYAESTTYMNTTAAMAGGLDTRPQQTDGVELLTASIVPKRAANKLRIESAIPFGSVGDNGVWFALFQDSAAAAIHAAVSAAAKSAASVVKLETDITAGTTSTTTIKLRFGNLMGNKDLLSVNGGSTARWMGGASRVTLSITEHG